MDDIDILTEKITGKSRAFLLAHPDYDYPPAQKRKLLDALRRYRSGVPAAYIVGSASFFGDEYTVGPDCLIPRGDTEFLAERAISMLPENGCFADLCTGSGCVAISVLRHLPDASCLAVDLSEKALQYAQKNAVSLDVARRLVLMRADVFKPSFLLGYTFDLIVSNPPYIPSKVVDTLDEYVQKEPRMALDGGKDGLDFYRFIIPEYAKFLNPGGAFLFEIGYDQGEALKEISIASGAACTIFRDYEEHDRIALVKPISMA